MSTFREDRFLYYVRGHPYQSAIIFIVLWNNEGTFVLKSLTMITYDFTWACGNMEYCYLLDRWQRCRTANEEGAQWTGNGWNCSVDAWNADWSKESGVRYATKIDQSCSWNDIWSTEMYRRSKTELGRVFESQRKMPKDIGKSISYNTQCEKHHQVSPFWWMRKFFTSTGANNTDIKAGPKCINKNFRNYHFTDFTSHNTDYIWWGYNWFPTREINTSKLQQ